MNYGVYENYGDVNFFEYGRLLKARNDTEFDIIFCDRYDEPDPDTNEVCYRFGDGYIDISDSWIDWNSVLSYWGVPDIENPVEKALAAFEYYGPDEFGWDRRWGVSLSKQEIKQLLHYYGIPRGEIIID